MKEMLSVSHLCFPNYTEACLLTDSEYKEEGISQKEAYELIDKPVSYTHLDVYKRQITDRSLSI